MKKYTAFLLLSLTIICLSACSDKDKNEEEFHQLVSWMSGSFSSEEQSVIDTNYFNIHLHMIPIWTERNDAAYLYVEQAASWTPEKPYRQRVYKVTRIDNRKFISEIYLIPNPLRFAGSWKNENPLMHLTIDSLKIKDGCGVILEKDKNAFIGSTESNKCKSNLRGAAYTTSEVYIDKEMIRSWDRGFDENDEQVWGAVNGPYIFKRLKSQ